MAALPKSVWKYATPLRELDDVLVIDMPAGAVVLSVANQREHLAVYAEVCPGQRTTTPHRFRIAGTGHPIDMEPGQRFIGTVLFADGDLVFHVYELPRG